MDDDSTPTYDGVFDDIVDRLAPEEITHTLTKSPNWDDERAGDVTVFTPVDGGRPIVYDPEERAFMPEDRYRRTLDAVRRAAHDEDGLMEMLSEVDGAVEKRDVLMHFNDDRAMFNASYPHDRVETIGYAVDGEGYTLARVKDSEPGQETYAIVRSAYTPDGPVRDVTGDEITVARTDVPEQTDTFPTKISFLDRHLLSRYSANREQALEMVQDAYSRSVDL